MRRRLICLILVSCLVAVGEATGCSTPVFRFALEKWSPATYEATLFHRGPLLGPDLALVEKLEAAARSANLNVRRLDLDGKMPTEARVLWTRNKGDAPFVVVQFPDEDEKAPPAWTGSLASAVELLTDSPARREVARLLLSGESAVWVLLASGDKKADDAAATLLQKELTRLGETLKLPPAEDDDIPLRAEIPLRLSFRMLRLERTPQERTFVSLLLGVEEDLDKVKGPIIVPIFGRGRALTALSGKALTAAQIERWASFLCGPCSCRVKELNPGTDLLMATDWDRPGTAPEPKAPPADRLANVLPVPTIPPGEPPAAIAEPTEEPVPENLAGWWWAGGASFLGVLGLVLLFRRICS